MIISFLYNNIKEIESIGRDRRQLFYNLYNNLGRKWGRAFIEYLLEHNAIMWPTFQKAHPWFNQQTFYKILKQTKPFLKGRKITDKNLIGQGNQPKIYMWKCSTYDDFQKEQSRYAKLLKEEREAEREFIRLQQHEAVLKIEAEKLEKANRFDIQLERVLEVIRPHGLTQLTPLYDVMDQLGIHDSEERVHVKEFFVRSWGRSK